MSALPDMTEESFLTIPANTQRRLSAALRLLFKDHPELGKFTGSATTLWEDCFEITPEGGEFLANLLSQTQYQKKLQPDVLHQVFEQTQDWPTEHILTQPVSNVCGCLGPRTELEQQLNLCVCAFANFVYSHRHQLVEYRRQNQVY